ncbi:MAG TPA: HD domain-containing phosphohydrolase [Dehalococcoidia bacterium]|nr:HD domain-containing phosphohydrolase [Dehalococcoidia bacterium]
MRRVLLVDVVPGMVLHGPVAGPDGEPILAAGRALAEADIAMLRSAPTPEIEIEDALVMPARELFPQTNEAAALQALNAIVMMQPGLDEPLGHERLEKLIHALDQLADGLFPDLAGEADFAGPDSLQGHDYIHPVKVAELAMVIGRMTGMHKPELMVLAQAATLMNIGYSALHRSLLDEPRALEEHEWQHHVELHPDYSQQILARSGLPADALTAIAQHHERWDGSGYPHKLRGEKISVYARIIAIADTYISLRSRRAYRTALPHREALELIVDGADDLFDPDLVRVFQDAAAMLAGGGETARAGAVATAGASGVEEASARGHGERSGAADDAAPAPHRERLHEADHARPEHAPARGPDHARRPAAAAVAGGTRPIAVGARPAPAAAPRSIAGPPPAQRRQTAAAMARTRRARRSLWSAAGYLASAERGDWSALVA